MILLVKKCIMCLEDGPSEGYKVWLSESEVEQFVDEVMDT
jgi:hypothetical protein